MRPLTRLAVLFFALFTLSCQELLDDGGLSAEELELRRMPFNQRVFLLNKNNETRKSTIFEVIYDFQGLTGDAILRKLPLTFRGEEFELPGGAHIAIDPTKNFIIAANRGKVWVIGLETDEDGLHPVKRLKYETRPGSVTQVDFDQNDYLFLAGRGGFYRVSTLTGGNEVWNSNDGDVLKVSELSFNDEIEMADEGEDEEDYFDDLEPGDTDYKFIRKMQRRIDNGRFRFAGGDITFTQNAGETGGFEQQRLITFTQWGNMAAAVSLEIKESGTMKYRAKALFRVRKTNKTNGKGTNKVTGAALMGDNLLITSHHKTNDFSVWNMNGEELARPTMVFEDPSLDFGLHDWGDMATTQTFDGNINSDDRFIGQEDAYFPFVEGSEIAEVKRYRPGQAVIDRYDVSQSDNPGVSLEARRNSANSDIVDLRRNARKFTSLGGGDMVMRFTSPIDVSAGTRLQVVETSWNKEPSYENTDDAWSAYRERASIYVSNSTEKYIGAWADEEANWVKVGDAFIASNIFPVDGLVESFQWVRIVDDASRTPDGFDVNFVAAFEEEVATVDPFCTNESVIVAQGGTDTKAPVRLTAMGTYIDGDYTGYRWRLRNNTDAELAVDWDLYKTDVTGSWTIPARHEVHFSTDQGGTMRAFVDGVQKEVKAHGGSARNLADCQ